MKYQMKLSNGKRSEATESNSEECWSQDWSWDECEVEASGMHVTSMRGALATVVTE